MEHRNRQRMATLTLVQYAFFTGVILMLGLVPNMGYIMLPFAAITLVHMPVIIGSYQFGPKGGTILGFFFGLTSFISCFIQPDAIAAVVLGTSTGFGLYNLFLIVAILFLPRILTGLFAGLIYRALSRFNGTLAMAVAAVAGSLSNTIFLLGGLYIFAFGQSGAAFGLAAGYTGAQFLKVLLGIVAFNGLLEAAAAMLICTAVGKALLHFTARIPQKQAKNNTPKES